MTTQSKRCGALTRKGTPCRRLGAQEYGGLCAQHGTKRSGFKGVGQTIKNTAEIGANVVKIAGGILFTVNYISSHWGAIRHALSMHGICFVTDGEIIEPQLQKFGLDKNGVHRTQIDELAQEAKDLTAKSRDIVLQQTGSPEECIELQRRFTNWFSSLPDEVRQKAESNAGKSTIDQLLLQ